MSERRILLLENPEILKKLNPWRIDIVKEIDAIYGILKEDLNLIIAGIAADNASLIYNRKIETIEMIYKKKSYRKREYYGEIIVPNIRIRYSSGKSLIDISDLIDVINEVIESKIKGYKEEKNVPIEFEPYSHIEERIEDVKKDLEEVVSKINRPILFSDLVKRYRWKYTALELLYAIIFLYMDGKIDLDTLEDEEGVSIDLILKKV